MLPKIVSESDFYEKESFTKCKNISVEIHIFCKIDLSKSGQLVKLKNVLFTGYLDLQ